MYAIGRLEVLASLNGVPRLEMVGKYVAVSLVIHSRRWRWVEVYSGGGLGWFRHDLEASDGQGTARSGRARLGLKLASGVALAVHLGLVVQAEGQYGVAYVTVFEAPAWVGGYRLGLGLRYSLLL